MAVCHPDTDILELVFLCVDIAVAHGLCLVDQNRFLQTGDMTVNSLDLVNGHATSVFCRENAVGAPLHSNFKGNPIIGYRYGNV